MVGTRSASKYATHHRPRRRAHQHRRARLSRGVDADREPVLPAHAHLDTGLGDPGHLMECVLRLLGDGVVRARVVFRPRCLYGHIALRAGGSVALVRHTDRHGGRGHRRRVDRLADIPAAWPLLRFGDARLPACAPLYLRVARLPRGVAADEARIARGVHAVSGLSVVCRHRLGDARGGDGERAQDRASC